MTEKLIPVHVAWNDSTGETEWLMQVEFTSDCNFLTLETDSLDGDPIKLLGRDSFRISLTAADRDADKGESFAFVKLQPHVGNIMWDMLWMTPEEAGRFAVFLQGQKHWTLVVSSFEIFNRWGRLTEQELQASMIKRMQE
jgi:hypothetical protein